MKRLTASHEASHDASGAGGERGAPVECRGGIQVRKGGREDVSIELFGELDVAAVDGLGEILAWASDSGCSVTVGLSGVTFLDSACLRELAVHQALRPARVALCDPSPQVEIGVAACDLEAWVHFRFAAARRPTAGSSRRAREGERERW